MNSASELAASPLRLSLSPRFSPFRWPLVTLSGPADHGAMVQTPDPRWSPRTLAAQALGRMGRTTRAIVPPIHVSTTYLRDLEAYAAGIPCVSTDVGNVSELLEGDRRFIAPSKDADKIAQGIEYVLEHPDEMAKLAKHNRERTVATYESRSSSRAMASCTPDRGSLMAGIGFEAAQARRDPDPARSPAPRSPARSSSRGLGSSPRRASRPPSACPFWRTRESPRSSSARWSGPSRSPSARAPRRCISSSGCLPTSYTSGKKGEAAALLLKFALASALASVPVGIVASLALVPRISARAVSTASCSRPPSLSCSPP